MIPKFKTSSSRDLFIGVTGSIVGAFIVGGFKWLLNLIPVVGNSMVDAIYYIAAQTTHDQFDRILLLSMFGLFFGLIVPAVIDAWKIRKQTINLEKSIELLGENGYQELERTLLDKEFKKRIEENKNKDNNESTSVKEIIKQDKKYSVVILLGFLAFIFSYIVVIAYVLYPNQLLTNFERDIKMIYPYVEEADIRILESDWVSMHSTSDYNEIYVYIDEVKETNNLPK